jgi:hypothetical protein
MAELVPRPEVVTTETAAELGQGVTFPHMEAIPPALAKPERKAGLIAVLILSVSMLLRWLLIFQGGQYYFSDEQRYQTSQQMTELLLEGKARDASLLLFSSPEHLGYKVIGIIPALLEQILGPSLVLPAMFFSLFSVLNLYLIFLLSRRVGASTSEALWTLSFAALSQCLFFYVRHFMPYDVAMTFGLLALYVGLIQKPDPGTSAVCGVLSLICFIAYNGSWTLALLAMLVHLFHTRTTITDIFRKIVLVGLGFLLPLLALLVISAQLGVNLLQEYRRFAGTVTQGSFEEGWTLAFAYFWHAEHFLFVVLGCLASYALLKGRNRKAAILWGSCVVFIYLCLALPSVFLHSFVVYGRLVRQIMPFLILLAANGLTAISQPIQSGPKITLAVLLVVLVQAAWNFNITFRVAFPRDVVRKVQSQHADFNFSPKRFAFGAPEICENNGYAMQNAKYFLDVPQVEQAIPGQILLSAFHPVNFLPYQYEGYTPEQRQAFRQAQLRMVFYKLDPKVAAGEDLKKIGIMSCLTK